MLSSQVHYCGFTSIDYGAVTTTQYKLEKLTKEECIRTIENESYVYVNKGWTRDQVTKIPVIPGIKTRHVAWTRGGYSISHHCESQWDDDWTDDGLNRWDSGKSYGYAERTYFDIYVSEVKGKLQRTSQEVKFGTARASFAMGQLEDGEMGQVFWEPVQAKCQDDMVLIYDGNATVHRLKSRLDGTYGEGDLLLAADTKQKQFFGLMLQGGGFSGGCGGVRMYPTNLWNISVVFVRQRQNDALFAAPFDPNVHKIKADILSTTAYMHFKSEVVTGRTFSEVRYAICLVERRLKQTQLALVLGNQNHMAIRDLFGAGASVQDAGAIIYVEHCNKVDVTPTPYNLNCTLELPVLFQNETWFMDQYTEMLKKFPTKVVCSEPTPIVYKWGGRFYVSSPKGYMPYLGQVSLQKIQMDNQRGIQGSVFSSDNNWLQDSQSAFLRELTDSPLRSGHPGDSHNQIPSVLGITAVRNS
jgi:hypothetical protein